MSSSSSIATNCKDSSPVNLPYLPDDLLSNCLARVSRLYYPTLSLVSKRFRFLLASKELYQTRTLLGCTESCLYVCLVRDSNPRWFTLCRKPTRIPNPNPKPTLVSIPTRNSSPLCCWDPIAVGSNIYTFGGDNSHEPSSRVFFLDCRSNTWHEAPNMQVSRKHPSASVLDGKIYVAGSNIECYYNSSKKWVECFDPKTQKWEHVPIHDVAIPKRYILKSLAIEGHIYVFGDTNVVYKPRWDDDDAVGDSMMMNSVGDMLHFAYTRDSICVIDNILYCYGLSKRLVWYDSEVRSWMVLKGVEELNKLPNDHYYVRLANYGGKIAVLWEEVHANEIWCAEISLKRHKGHEIFGKVEWCGVVLTIPKSCHLEKFVAVTV